MFLLTNYTLPTIYTHLRLSISKARHKLSRSRTPIHSHTERHPTHTHNQETTCTLNKFVEAKHFLFQICQLIENSNGTAIEKSLICSSFFSLIIFLNVSLKKPNKTKKKSIQIVSNQNSPN